VWHAQLPAWINAIASPTELTTTMQTHINIVMGHYKGKINAWEVVNEAFADNGTLRRSVWTATLGSNTNWIETAFRTARAADPAAKLCYDDYNIESWDNPKTQAVYAMVRDFKARGVPMDCVGFEAHFTATWPVPSSFQATLQSFAALGVDVQLTELDVEGSGAAQASSFSTAVAACQVVSRCTGISVSQIRDSDTFRTSATPLLFDRYGAKKPAYDAVLSRFYPGPVTPPAQSTSAPVTSAAVSSQLVPTSGQPAACTATYRLVSAWQGGFQGEVTVRNNSATTIYSWTASLGLQSGQSTNNLWNGVPSATSGTIAVRNAPHNGTLAANSTTTFGFVAGGPSTPAPTVSCATP
jgi:endo-1,4-beta-xylanase